MRLAGKSPRSAARLGAPLARSVRLRLATLAACLVFAALQDANANNMVVTNVLLTGQNVAGKTAYVNFDVRWDNSWWGTDGVSTNWDAAWVFVKFQAPGSNKWQHATLSTNGSDHIPAAGSVVNATADGKGVFIYGASAYTGSVNYLHVKLLWNYGLDGYSFPKGASVNVSAQAIEMVYIPQGSFYLGSGGTESYRFYQYTDGSQTSTPFSVTSEAAIPVGQSLSNLYYQGSGDQVGPIPAAFPKGYNAFYCMKYEISQGQYADFLNKLTGLQWTNRFPNQNSYRHTIAGTCTNVSASAPDRACNYFFWWGGCAYAAWAGLRPMTELEFEKACRGPANPVAKECAWGTTNVTVLMGFVGVDGTGTESASPATANCLVNPNPSPPSPVAGPARCGIYATAGSGTNRQSAGASYWGVMELSGNLWELCITACTTNGRAFLGTHGSGVLNATGNATNSDWGAASGLNPSSHGKRGSDWSYYTGQLPTSDRNYAIYEPADWGEKDGFRAVRTAP